jgi:hypothetical protein
MHYFGRKQKVIHRIGIAVDSSNPEVVIISASNGPSRSYVAEDAETFAYRKDAADGNRWKTVTDGLPKARGSFLGYYENHEEAQMKSCCDYRR